VFRPRISTLGSRANYPATFQPGAGRKTLSPIIARCLRNKAVYGQKYGNFAGRAKCFAAWILAGTPRSGLPTGFLKANATGVCGDAYRFAGCRINWSYKIFRGMTVAAGKGLFFHLWGRRFWAYRFPGQFTVSQEQAGAGDPEGLGNI